jgi:hypothetical protein
VGSGKIRSKAGDRQGRVEATGFTAGEFRGRSAVGEGQGKGGGGRFGGYSP